MKIPGPPPLDGLRSRIFRYRQEHPAGGKSEFVRETFCLSRPDARAKAREWFDEFPKAAYWTEIESWCERPDDVIEFTMRRLATAD